MKKVILPVILAATLLIVAAGAVFPFLLTPGQHEKLHRIPLQPLDYGDGIGPRALTMREKLRVLQRGGQRISVSSEIMDYSADEIIPSLLKTLDQFSDSGILAEDLDNSEISAFPCMIFSSDTGEKYSKYWNVFFDYYGDEKNYQITCLVDDDTRNLMTISCEFFNSFLISGNPEDCIRSFAERYFRNLGIEDAKPYNGFEAENAWYYQIPGEENGRILVEFLYMEYDTGSWFQINMIPDVMTDEMNDH